MTMRTSRKMVTFQNAFSLAAGDREFSAGNYEVVTDEELVEGVSFPVYRRVATMMLVPAQSHQASSVEMLTIDPRDLAVALERDVLTADAFAVKARPASAQVT